MKEVLSEDDGGNFMGGNGEGIRNRHHKNTEIKINGHDEAMDSGCNPIENLKKATASNKARKEFLEGYFRRTGTAAEVVHAGPVAGYLNIPLKSFFNGGTFPDFAALHGISGFGAAGIFAFLGTAFKYAVRYYDEAGGHLDFDPTGENNPTLSVSKFYSEHKAEMWASLTSLLLVGGVSFAFFTGAGDFCANNQNMHWALSDFISLSVGMSLFAGGNGFLAGLSTEDFNIKLPWEKLADIAGVFLGFIAGGHLTHFLSPLVDEWWLTWFVQPWVAPVLGAGGALVGGGVRDVLSSAYNLLPSFSMFSPARRNIDENKVTNNVQDDVKDLLDADSSTDDKRDTSCADYCPKISNPFGRRYGYGEIT